ncbi:MAG: hypothetical protein Q7J47_10350 [Azoarcus sp.]|nr:hypothetical protein [Azoarcus sp.]
MPAQTLLAIDAHGLKVWLPTGRTLEPGVRFDSFDDAGANRFREWLHTQARSKRYAVLADLAEERFALERLPRTRPGDARAMIQRKLGQHFPDTPFTTNLPLGKQASGGTFNRVLLCALTRPALLTPWVNALTEAGAVVTRLTSTPLLLDQWNRRRLRHKGQFVLLTVTPSGMRLSLFCAGRLRLSRMVPARGDSLAQSLPHYQSELLQTRSYLAAQHLIGNDAPLQIKVLAASSDQAALLAIIDSGEGLEAEFLDLHSHLRHRPPASAKPGSDAMPLLLQQLVRDPPSAHYAPPELCRGHSLTRLRTGMIGTASLASLVCLLAASSNLLELRALEQDVATAKQAQRALAQEADTLIRDRPATPAPAARMDAWLSGLDRRAAEGIAPIDILRQISTLLETVPSLRLDTLAWRRADPQRDMVLLPPALTGKATHFVIVDIGASLPPASTHNPEEVFRHSAALIDRLQQDLGQRVQVRHRPSPPASAALPRAGHQSAVTGSRHHLELTFALATFDTVTFTPATFDPVTRSD